MITNKAEQKLQRRQWTGFACVLGAYAKKGGGERYSVTVTERVTSHSNGGEHYSVTVTESVTSDSNGGERYSVTVTESVTSHSNGIPKGGAIGRKDKTVVMA